MQAVLYVSHGSRVEKALREAISFIEMVQKRIDVPLQEVCFLELANPDVAQGIARLVKQGASRIAVIPVLLLSAGHYYKDIPEEIEEAKTDYPEVTFTYGKPLGVQDRIVRILAERVAEIKTEKHEDAGILLVGRGSRMPETTASIEAIAAKLQTATGVAQVDTCYLAACAPSFDEGLQGAVRKARSQTFIIPYLWFTGLLMQSMEQKVDKVQQADRQLILCPYLGNHPVMADALTDRVYQALKS